MYCWRGSQVEERERERMDVVRVARRRLIQLDVVRVLVSGGPVGFGR